MAAEDGRAPLHLAAPGEAEPPAAGAGPVRDRDSGGFTELSKYGAWATTVDRYIAEVRRCADCIGVPVFAAQMDHTCEPFILEKTPRVVGVAYFGPLHLCTERTSANLLRPHRPQGVGPFPRELVNPRW